MKRPGSASAREARSKNRGEENGVRVLEADSKNDVRRNVTIGI